MVFVFADYFSHLANMEPGTGHPAAVGSSIAARHLPSIYFQFLAD